MTITKKEFDIGEDETTACVLNLLEKYSDEAFTAQELAKTIDTAVFNVLVALINLVGNGRVKGKFVGLDYYYMMA